MLSFAVANFKELAPDNVIDVGFFAIPGGDAASNGLTTWMPAGLYIPKTSQHQAEAKAFMAFVASIEGCDIQTQFAAAATGHYFVKGCALPTDVSPVVSHMLP